MMTLTNGFGLDKPQNFLTKPINRGQTNADELHLQDQ
jgi:hypothetical protein